MFTLRACTLDRAGIPATDDCFDTAMDLSTIRWTTLNVTAGGWTDVPWYHPYARIRLLTGAELIIPMEPDQDPNRALNSLELLHDALTR
jgi:hypothetical protein